MTEKAMVPLRVALMAVFIAVGAVLIVPARLLLWLVPESE